MLQDSQLCAFDQKPGRPCTGLMIRRCPCWRNHLAPSLLHCSSRPIRHPSRLYALFFCIAAPSAWAYYKSKKWHYYLPKRHSSPRKPPTTVTLSQGESLVPARHHLARMTVATLGNMPRAPATVCLSPHPACPCAWSSGLLLLCQRHPRGVPCFLPHQPRSSSCSASLLGGQ